jgi:quinol monooxygenase YgiN
MEEKKMIKIVAKVVVKEECIEAFHEAARELIEKSRQEEGNISYTLNQSIQDPKVHSFMEVWKDIEAIKAHNASEHFTSAMPKLGALAEGPMAADLYKEII